ncbi:hypothetical protein BMJ35_18205 [Sinorhizobium medicae]|uniref:hypothetical protein n=1 Tax=Sinorhizobium medicae TaxID=110321 RepID=UPI000C7CDFB7|nr:hypothetical protein [Sinorhizobium medicae]MDX0977438.1 hypothetical protein [Sinorhizobium medicae]PLT86791.1 hypothetical protein BMJ35_18205 [Sinorhizobium medicae]
MLATLAIIVLAASGPSPTCVAAAHRFTSFLVEFDKKVQELAASMDEDRCAFILAAPDSTVKALAIAALPERNGK